MLSEHQEEFTVRVTKHCHRLPREFVKSPSPEKIKNPPGRGPEQPALGNPAWAKGLNTINPQRFHLTSSIHKKGEPAQILSSHIYKYQLSKSYNSHSKTVVFPQTLFCSTPFPSSVQAHSTDYIPRSSTRSSLLYIKLSKSNPWGWKKRKEILYSIRKIFDISAYIE